MIGPPAHRNMLRLYLASCVVLVEERLGVKIFGWYSMTGRTGNEVNTGLRDALITADPPGRSPRKVGG